MSGGEDSATHSAPHKSNFNRRWRHSTTELTGGVLDSSLCLSDRLSDRIEVGRGWLVLWNDLGDTRRVAERRSILG